MTSSHPLSKRSQAALVAGISLLPMASRAPIDAARGSVQVELLECHPVDAELKPNRNGVT